MDEKEDHEDGIYATETEVKNEPIIERREVKVTLLDKLFIANNFVCVGAGAYHGFCSAKGIEMNKDSFEASLLYGPSIIMAGLGSFKPLYKRYNQDIGMMGHSICGLIHGGIVTSIGFGLGYIAGKLTD